MEDEAAQIERVRASEAAVRARETASAETTMRLARLTAMAKSLQARNEEASE